MRVSRLFTDQELNVNSSISLNEKQSHYLTHVLRFKKLQAITLFNGLSEFDYHSQITKTGKLVELHIEESSATHNESPIKISIIQALSKNEHIDLMIQKCTELGINSIIIFNSQRTQIPLKNNKLEKKLNHWNRIAQSACEQCGRSIVPNIKFIPRFDDALNQQPSQRRIMLDFDGSSLISAIDDSNKLKSIDILLGAEGGLSSDEIILAQQSFKKIRLGTRVLRTETAAITAVSLIQMLVGDLN